MASGVNASLREFIEERMAVYDSDIDTDSGSEFDQLVIVPLLNRLGPDTTETDAEQIVIDRVRTHDPTISVDVGSGIRDGLITPLGAILEPFRRAVNLVLLRNSWTNVESMTNEEADILAENVFYYRDEGEKSIGSIRLKFASPRDVSVTLQNVAYAGSLRFVPTLPQSISRLEMTAQMTGAYYYMDVSMIAEQAGEEYNVEAGTISEIDGVTGVVGVEQLADFRDGRTTQTNLELRDAAQTSIVVRNLVTERSILTVLPDQEHYPEIGAILVVGRMDPAMSRDLVYGPASIGGIPQGIKGGSAPDIVVGEKFHMGGFTDIWAAPSASTSDVTESIDVKNISDEGALVFSSETGYVNAGTPGVLEDIRAFFTEVDEGFLPVQVDDYVIVEGQHSGGQHIEYVVTAVNDTDIEVTPDIASGSSLSEVSYEIRRRYPGFVSVSVDTLVAEADGSPVLDSSGNPYLPKPGLVKESEGVLAASNKGSGNVSLPLFYISRVEFLDPITDQPTGEVVPEGDPIVLYISDRASSSVVWVRVVYRYPTRFVLQMNHKLWTLDAGTYYVPPVLSGTATLVSSTVVEIDGVHYDSTPYVSCYPDRKPQPGDYIEYYDPASPGTALAGSVVVATNVGASNRYEVEEAVLPFPGTPGYEARILQGSRKSDMTSTDAFGFYYFDMLMERYTGTRQEVGTPLASPTNAFLLTQGWRLVPRLEGYGFSTLEEPGLTITSKVNDTTDVDGESIRITYLTTPLFRDVQDFLDSDSERVPAEDMLIRRMPPARVHIAMNFKPDSVTDLPTEEEAESGLAEYIEASVSSEEEAYGSATAISNVVEELGARKVEYPFSTIVEYAGKARSGQGLLGRLMSFHGYDGFSVPENISTAIESLFRMAQFIPGNIEVVED